MTIGSGIAYAGVALACAAAAYTTGQVEAINGLAVIPLTEFLRAVLKR